MIRTKTSTNQSNLEWWLRRFFPLVTIVAILVLATWLRLTQLDRVPPAPYWEEAALGYDAYSISQTGQDHHGHPWPIVAFESFGDWKPSGYFYAAAASIKVLGLTIVAVRLPAAIAGIILVGLIAWLARLVHLRWQIGWASWPVIVLAVAAISPWGIQFSRAAWEVMLATMLFVAALGCELVWLGKWLKRERLSWLWAVAAVGLAVAAMYTYHALRLIAPFMLIWTFGCWVWQTGWVQVAEYKRHWQSTLLVSVGLLAFTLSLLWPLLHSLGSPEVQQRFAETSILTDIQPIETSNAIIAAHSHSVLARIIYHRYWFQAQTVATQFFSHLDLGFLFLHGDKNARHSIQYFGQLYYFDAVFAAVGVFFLWKKHKKFTVWLAGWWLIGTFPAALTLAAPHALRTLPTWPVWMLLIGYGISVVTHRRWWLLGLVSGGYLFLLVWFWHTYTRIYPQRYSEDWQAGYCEMYQELQPWLDRYPSAPVFISRQVGRPAMYLWFCQKTDPIAVQATETTIPKDQGEFLEFGRFKFVRGISEIPSIPAIVVVSQAEKVQLASHAATLINTTIFWQNQPKWFVLKQ